MQQIKMQRVTQVVMPIAMLFAMGLPVAMAQRATSDRQPAAADPLQIKLVRSKVVLDRGREVQESASVAKPGEILEEVATYTNTSRSALKNLEATLPVPANTELVMASVKPANVHASADGKAFATLPLVRKMRQPGGVEVDQPVPLAEYRYLRWYPGELAPGKSMSFSARFKVANTPIDVNGAAK